jgi:hypothetical protein
MMLSRAVWFMMVLKNQSRGCLVLYSDEIAEQICNMLFGMRPECDDVADDRREAHVGDAGRIHPIWGIFHLGGIASGRLGARRVHGKNPQA